MYVASNSLSDFSHGHVQSWACLITQTLHTSFFQLYSCRTMYMFCIGVVFVYPAQYVFSHWQGVAQTEQSIPCLHHFQDKDEAGGKWELQQDNGVTLGVEGCLDFLSLSPSGASEISTRIQQVMFPSSFTFQNIITFVLCKVNVPIMSHLSK